ncbi:hypothetical protein RMATCC62417_15646 [Rhizopus microsporus]|nr:hypothetical protein RMATCC62417_15646 [Rhizopus microsporus]
MRDAGQVVHVDIMKLSNGKSKGCGIVEYRYPEDAKRAIQMLNEVRFMGRYVYVRYLRGPKGEKDFDSVKEAPEDCRIFVRNLPPNFSWQDLKDLFRKAGRVLHTDVFNDPETRRPNGTGVVIFDNLSDTRHAISTLNGYNLHGNRIEVMQEKFKDVQADINQVTTSPRSAVTAGVVTPANATVAISAHTTNIPPPPPPMSSVSDSHYYRSSSSSSPPPPPPPPSSTMIEQPMPPSPYQNVHRFGEPVPPPPPVYPGVSLVGGPAADLPTHGHNQIYVNNLPFSTTWQDLIDLFRHVGPVMRAEILVINGYPKGAGYVRFEDAETCQRAIGKIRHTNVLS